MISTQTNYFFYYRPIPDFVLTWKIASSRASVFNLQKPLDFSAMGNGICTTLNPWSDESSTEGSDDEESSPERSSGSNTSRDYRDSDRSDGVLSSCESDDNDSVHFSGDESDDSDDSSDSNSSSNNRPLGMATENTAFWTPGQTLRIKFMNGDHRIQEKVEKYARMWEKHANINFDFICEGESEIRISFQSGGDSNSYVGNHALNVDPNKPTMNLGLKYTDTENTIRSTVLHEFGHALGCIHEHSSPSIKIKWNRAAVYRDNLSWSKSTVHENIFRRYCRKQTKCSKFDPKSIMLYHIPKYWTKDGWSSKNNTRLSAADKAFIAEVYPGRKKKRRTKEPKQPRKRRRSERKYILGDNAAVPHWLPTQEVSGNRCGNSRCGIDFVCNHDYK